MPNRVKSCGSCSLCCKVLAVDQLKKPMGAWCPHHGAGAGCTIHATRPHACRTFDCVWLMDPEMPQRFRPDRTKVVLDQDAAGRRLIARCDPANPRAWRRDPIYAALKGYAADSWGSGRIVLAVAGRRVWVITPTSDLDIGELDPHSELKVTERPDGTVEVTVTA
jgi:hypothetical protein